MRSMRASPEPQRAPCSPSRTRSWCVVSRYSSITCAVGPTARSTPFSSHAASSHRLRIDSSVCDTMTTVLPRSAQIVELLRALRLELGVTDREDLVDEQDVGVDVDGDREPEPHVHARRVVLDRRVDELLEPGEVDDLVEALPDLLLAQAEDRTVEVDVLAPGQLGVEAGTELEQRGDLPGRVDAAAVGPEDARHALEQRRLPRAVLAHEPVRLPPRDVERDVAQGPQVLVPGPPAAHERRLQRLVPLVVQPVPLRDVDDGDRRVGRHTSSASRRSRRPKTQ